MRGEGSELWGLGIGVEVLSVVAFSGRSVGFQVSG